MTKFLRVGKILKSQGIKGEAKVMPTTSDIKRFSNLKSIYLINNDNVDFDLDDKNSKILDLENVKYLNDAVVLKFKNIDRIEDIEKYKGYSLYISKDDAIGLDDNEYFISDLIGLKVILQDKEGIVSDIEELKNQTNLIIDIEGKSHQIPFNKDYIKNIDIDKKVIILNMIEGMLDI